jgi:predicted nuclease of predicted toxin-antitoxin system
VLEHLAFLIDENLTPELAEMAQGRGYHALHTTWTGLRGRRDPQIAKHAIDHDMILVTNNMVDFRRIYRRRRLHPGLAFLSVTNTDIMDREAQRAMFEAALDNIEDDEPINQAVNVELADDVDGNWVLTVTRYPLP